MVSLLEPVILLVLRSQEELMESLESTHRELDATSERLRTVEAQRIAATREAESLRHRLEQAEQLGRSLQAGLRQRWGGGTVVRE